MKELDTKEMDSEDQELYSMLRSKFNPKEMERLSILMIIDAEKYHQEKLNKNIDLGDVIKWRRVDDMNIIDWGVAYDLAEEADGLVKFSDGSTKKVSEDWYDQSAVYIQAF
jgi:hypothetical protein